MHAWEPPDLFGNSAGMCADRAEPTFEERLAARQRFAKRGPPVRLAEPAPLPEDALPGTMCLRCGMRGQHQTADTCIAALRDRLADVTGR